MTVRNEIKAQIVRAGYTMQEVVDLLHEEYDWSDSVSNLSAKLQRESIATRRLWSWPMCWATTWSGRNGGSAYESSSTPFSALPSTRGRKSAISKPTTSVPRRSTPAIPMWTSAEPPTISIWSTPQRKYRAEAERQIAEAGCRTRGQTVCAWWRRW